MTESERGDLHKCHFAAKCRVDVREFETDVAAANDGNPWRQPIEFESMVRCEHGLAIDGNAWVMLLGQSRHSHSMNDVTWRDKRNGTGRNDNVGGCHFASHIHPTRQSVAQSILPNKPSIAVQNIDTQCLQRSLQIALDRIGQILSVIGNALSIKLHVSDL